MPALSYFNVVTWFAPENVVVASFFGVRSGLGMFPLTFDWAQVAYTGSPLVTPWWAAVNILGGLAIVMWLIAPIMYYSNTFFSAFLPMLSSNVFDDTGKQYDVSRILTPEFTFDRKAYEQYSKVYLPITYALSYGVQFASLSALVTHTACWYGRDIWQQVQGVRLDDDRMSGRRRFEDQQGSKISTSVQAESMAREDVHNRLMKRYEDAPITWYLAVFLSMLAVGIFVCE